MPEFRLCGLDVLQVGGVDAMRGVYALGDLVQVAAVPAHEREQLAQLRQVELQDAPVYGHLAQVCAEVFSAELSHLLLDLRLLVG